MISAHVDTRGRDDLPASNEDGDLNPTNSDPTGSTNTAVGSGKHQGGYYCKGGNLLEGVNPQLSGCLTPTSLFGWVWQLCVPGVQQYRPVWR